MEGYGASEFMYLPLSYKRITMYRPMSTRIYSHIRCRQDNTARREIATFDITLLDSEGKVVAEIQEFCMRRMAAALNSAAPIPRRAVVRPDSERAANEVKQVISVADGIKEGAAVRSGA